MALTFVETDTAGDCNTLKCLVGGSAGSVEQSPTIVAESADQVIAPFEIANIATYSGAAGNWTIRLSVTTANKNLDLTGTITLRHVDVSACNTIITTLFSGAASWDDTDLGATGVKTCTVTGALGCTLTANDAIRVGIGVSNAAMTNQSFGYTPNQNIDSPFTAASAALTGTITASVNEADIVTGSKTLIITLTGDTWIAAGAASFDLQRDEIIDGCDSAQSELFGWDLVPKALQSVDGVVRTSDTVVTITWDAFATYDITAQETITVTVPGTAVVLGNAIVATPTFTVAPVSGAPIKQMHHYKTLMAA